MDKTHKKCPQKWGFPPFVTPKIFFKNRALSLLNPYGALTSCKTHGCSTTFILLWEIWWYNAEKSIVEGLVAVWERGNMFGSALSLLSYNIRPKSELIGYISWSTFKNYSKPCQISGQTSIDSNPWLQGGRRFSEILC